MFPKTSGTGLMLARDAWSQSCRRVSCFESTHFFQEAEVMSQNLDSLHHVAISVKDIAAAVDWYRSTFRCEIVYQDATWAFLKFANLHLALVLPGQHPPHLAFVTPAAASFGELKPHRDGTRSIYISDVSGNAVELMDPDSMQAYES
jgi:catechol-2,3-dioxygenase